MTPLSDLPDALREVLAPSNTPEARLRASSPLEASVLAWTRGWRLWDFPGDAEACAVVRDWIATPTPAVRGLVLWGAPGRGKTSLAACAAAEAAERGDGDRAVWNLVTSESIFAAVLAGEYRQRPAPVWLERWGHLLDRLRETLRRNRDDEAPSGRDLLSELAQRVDLLVLDDMAREEDSGVLPSWQADALLDLVERPLRGQRLVLTCNCEPYTALAARVGGAIADRLLDPQAYLCLHVGGESLRR